MVEGNDLLLRCCEEANMDIPPPDHHHHQQLCLLRGTWQLASVFHFLNVFRSVLDLNVKFSMEELETALLVPNALLDDIHIGLLKAIPPISKNPINQETWITVLCKKLKDWWHFVAEGSFPLTAQHGEEIATYKDLSPDVRAIILKALCEARLDQEDMRAFIGEMVKEEASFLNIRKERTGMDIQGGMYWYENDPIAGQRLYRELQKSDKGKAKLWGHFVSPPITSRWETLATNLNEFQSLVAKLCSSRSNLEVVLGKKINSDIVPDVINAEKRKQRALKKQLRQAGLLENNFKSEVVAVTRSRRERKPVSYTFDDYDNSINEALEVMKVMVNSKLSNGSARQDSNKETEATPHLKSESMETETHSSKSDTFSNGRPGRGGCRGPHKSTKTDLSDATDSEADALSGHASEGEAGHPLNKRRLMGASGAEKSGSKGAKQVSDSESDCDGEEENMEPWECVAQISRDIDCVKHESDVDSKRSGGNRVKRQNRGAAEFELATSSCSPKKTSNVEEMNAEYCEPLAKSMISHEEGYKSKELQGSKVALGTEKQGTHDDCRPGKRMLMVLNSNRPGVVGV